MSTQELILAIETSSRLGSVALALGPELLAQTTFSAPMRHSAEIFDAINGLINRFHRKPAQINDIYISIGPGSFTGLRIAVTIAKAIHLANLVRIVPVNTLDVIAQNAPVGAPKQKIDMIATILDAKRSQFYIAVYKRSNNTSSQTQKTASRTQSWQRLIPDSLMTAQQFLDRFANTAKPIALLGDGLLHHKQNFHNQGTRILHEQYWSPQAAKVHKLGFQLAIANQFADPLKLIPSYIRRPEAEEKWQQR